MRTRARTRAPSPVPRGPPLRTSDYAAISRARRRSQSGDSGRRPHVKVNRNNELVTLRSWQQRQRARRTPARPAKSGNARAAAANQHDRDNSEDESMAQHLHNARKDIADSAAATDVARELASKYATRMPTRSIHNGMRLQGPLTRARTRPRTYGLRSRGSHQHFSALQTNDIFAGMTLLTNTDATETRPARSKTQALVPYQRSPQVQEEDLFAGMTMVATGVHSDIGTHAAHLDAQPENSAPEGCSGGGLE